MFGFEKKRQEEIIAVLIDATKVLNRSLAQLLSRIDPSASQDPFKLSYYSMSAVSYAFFMYSNEPDDKKIEILDTYASRLISKFHEDYKQTFDPTTHSSARLIRDYQNAHAGYSELLHNTFGTANGHPEVTMMTLLWVNVTGKTLQGKMIELMLASAELVKCTGEAFNMFRHRV